MVAVAQVVAAPAVADGINLGFVFCLLIRIFEYVESRLNHRKTQIYLVFRLVCTIFASEIKDEHTEEIIYGRTDGRHSDAGSGSADIGR